MDEDLERRFHELLDQWHEKTSHLSRIASDHEAYREIIGMGWPVVPIILREMRERPTWLFEALFAITGEWPCPQKHAGYLDALTQDWLQWGRERGFID